MRSFVNSSIRICRAEIEGMYTANVRAMEGVSLGVTSIPTPVGLVVIVEVVEAI